MERPDSFAHMGHIYQYDGAEHSTVGPTSLFYRCTSCGTTDVFAESLSGLVPWRRVDTGDYFGGEAPRRCANNDKMRGLATST